MNVVLDFGIWWDKEREAMSGDDFSKDVEQWVSAFLMLWPFTTASLIVVTPTVKLFSLLFTSITLLLL